MGGLRPDGLARQPHHVRRLPGRPRLPQPAGLDRQGRRRLDHALERRHAAVPEYEFKTKTYYGDVEGANLLDWPITLADLAPYYDQAEKAIGSTHRHGRAPQPANNNYKVFANGAERIGYKYYATGPYGTNAEPYDGRPASIQDGFNFQGDKNTSKWSTAVREVPRAIETGKCDLRAYSQAVQITHDASGRANAVLYLDKDGNLHRQAAKVVCVAGNSIESPRLLLMSASSLHPDGLANSSGQVGRNYMRHTTGSVYARFDKPVHMFRGETMAGIIADEARLDTSRGFARRLLHGDAVARARRSSRPSSSPARGAAASPS